MKKRRLVICGATGFIGRNLTQYFAKRGDFEVVGIFHSRPSFDCAGVEWVRADLRNAEDVSRVVKGCDVLIQAAATTSGAKDIVTRPFIHVTDNAVMNSLLLRAAYENKVANFLFFSCTVMYHSSAIPLREDDYDPARPLEPRYFGSANTKLYVEKICEFFAGLGEARFTVIRHSNIYGPHDKFDLEHSHVFGATLTKVMDAAPDSSITVWGNGEEGRDLLYISDLVDFVARAIDQQKSSFELVNLGSGRLVSVNEMVALILKASGKNLDIIYDRSQPSIATTIAIDSSRAKKNFSWSPQVSLEEGIAATLDWWRDNIGAA